MTVTKYVFPIQHLIIHAISYSKNAKSLCENMARASGGNADNLHSLSWGGGTNGKDPKQHTLLQFLETVLDLLSLFQKF